MSNPRQKATSLLKTLGAILVRKRKHEIWRLPDGRNWVRASTPSDSHSDANNFAQLKNLVGVEEIRIKNPDRVEKKKHGGDGKRRQLQPVGNSQLADALRLSGAAESVLRDRIRELESDLSMRENELRQMRESRDSQRRVARQLSAEVRICWGCRLRRLYKRFRSEV